MDNKRERLPRQLPETREQENFTHLMLTGSNSAESELLQLDASKGPMFWQDHPLAKNSAMRINAVRTTAETTTLSDTMSKYVNDESWSRSGGVSLDGLFVPFSANFVVKSDSGFIKDKNRDLHSNLPTFERPYSRADKEGTVVDERDTSEGATHPLLGAEAPSPQLITSVSLNPYASGHQIQHINKNQSFRNEDAGTIQAPTEVERYSKDIPTLVKAPEDSREVSRPMALRGPLVLAGWGYDTEGLPVPNMRYDADYKEDDKEADNFGEQKYTPQQMRAIDEQGNKNDHKHFIPNHLARTDKWKVGPVDLRWDRDRKVWTAGGSEGTVTNFYLCKAAKCILPKAGMDGNNSFNLGVGGNINSPGRLYRNPCPTIACNYNSYFPTSIHYPDIEVYDPEDHNWCGLCKTFGNQTACGDFADACVPFYDGLIIRKLSENVGGTGALKECTDKFRKAENGNPHARRAGNPCHGWGSSYYGKLEGIKKKIDDGDWTEAAKDILYEKIFIDNPLGQGLMVGDTFFSYDTGRRITHEYVRSETDGCGGQGGKKITVKETIAVHAILQAEFYGMEIISHAGCDRGEMAACSRKFFAQGFATGEDCGPDDDYAVTSTSYTNT